MFYETMAFRLANQRKFVCQWSFMKLFVKNYSVLILGLAIAAVFVNVPLASAQITTMPVTRSGSDAGGHGGAAAAGGHGGGDSNRPQACQDYDRECSSGANGSAALGSMLGGMASAFETLEAAHIVHGGGSDVAIPGIACGLETLSLTMGTIAECNSHPTPECVLNIKSGAELLCTATSCINASLAGKLVSAPYSAALAASCAFGAGVAQWMKCTPRSTAAWAVGGVDLYTACQVALANARPIDPSRCPFSVVQVQAPCSGSGGVDNGALATLCLSEIRNRNWNLDVAMEGNCKIACERSARDSVGSRCTFAPSQPVMGSGSMGPPPSLQNTGGCMYNATSGAFVSNSCPSGKNCVKQGSPGMYYGSCE